MPGNNALRTEMYLRMVAGLITVIKILASAYAAKIVIEAFVGTETKFEFNLTVGITLAAAVPISIIYFLQHRTIRKLEKNIDVLRASRDAFERQYFQLLQTLKDKREMEEIK